MRFNKAKRKVLHLCWGNPQFQYRPWDECVESSLVEKDLWVLVGEKWEHALAAQKSSCILGCIT